MGAGAESRSGGGTGDGSWTVEVFFDGDCPLCSREITLLRRLDRRSRVRFTDIAAPGFDPSTLGKSMNLLMDRIHGRLPDGTWIEGVEVFRQLYAAVGLGWVAWMMRLPGITWMLDWSYEVFAKNRLRWTGRCIDESCSLERAPARG